MAAVSILTILSHRFGEPFHSTLILHHSRPAARLVPAPYHHHIKYRDHGTKIMVQDLFGNMPVRIKQRAIADDSPSTRQREWESLRWNITGVLLAWNYPVSLSVKGPETHQRMKICYTSSRRTAASRLEPASENSSSFDTNLLRNTLIQGAKIDPSCWISWKTVSAQTLSVTIRAIISLQPAPTKGFQYISLGVRHLNHEAGNNILYDEVNHIFSSSNFGSQEDVGPVDSPDGTESRQDRRHSRSVTNKRLKGGGKGVDRWPMFYIRIESFKSKWVHEPQPDASLEDSSTLSSILEVLGTMVSSFLRAHDLCPRARPAGRRTIPKVSTLQPKLSCITAPISSKESERDEFASRLPALSIPKPSCTSRAAASKPLSIHDFGGNVKIPSFASNRSTMAHEEFGGWSRIKSARSTSDMKLGSDSTLPAGPTGRISDVQNVDEYETVDDAQAWLNAERSVLGEIAESPFLDQSTHDPGGQCNTAHHSSQNCNDQLARQLEVEASQKSYAISDALIPWTNPATKSTIYINARTGLVAHGNRPATPANMEINQVPTDRSSRPSTALSEWLKSARRNSEALGTPKAGSWADALLSSWENPVFPRTEQPIAQVQVEIPKFANSETCFSRMCSASGVEVENAFSISSSKLSAKLSRDALRGATILAQVDSKFILIKVAVDASNTSDDFSEDQITYPSHFLVLIDQHAADERIRIESLLSDLCSPPPTSVFKSGLGLASSIETTLLQKPLKFEISTTELILFRRHAPTFATWGILYDITRPSFKPSLLESQADCFVIIQALPSGIAERCRLDVQLLKDLMRADIYKREEVGTTVPSTTCLPTPPSTNEKMHELSTRSPAWISRIRDCPTGIINLLNSRSCRSAIMFNDVLTMVECETLVRRLAKCCFPFMCAHGRPSMVPLVALKRDGDDDDDDDDGVGGEMRGDGGSGFGLLELVGSGMEGYAGYGESMAEEDFGTAWERWMGSRKGVDEGGNVEGNGRETPES